MFFCIRERSEAVNCERSEQEGEEPLFNGPNNFPYYMFFCIGERSEAVNCERSEQEGEDPYSMAQIIFPTICFLHWGAKRGSELRT